MNGRSGACVMSRSHGITSLHAYACLPRRRPAGYTPCLHMLLCSHIALADEKKKRNNNNTFNKNTKPSVFACMLRCPKLKAVHSPSQSRQPFNSVASLYRLACIAEKITVSNSHQMSKIKSFITSDIQLTPSKPPLWPQTYKQETTYPCNLICA